MYLSRLSLIHYRNYPQLVLDFTHPYTLFQGRNAQGKTNLLEAIYFLSTSKPVHAQNEREVVDWGAQEEPIPYCRMTGEVRSQERNTTIEILLTPRGDGVNFTKQIKINGVGKRSMDLIGLMPTVLFLPEDIRLVDGSPGERRRYLDIALCQIDRNYCRTLLEYQKVVDQRNSLLKTLREQNVRPTAESTEAQLGFWDEKLVQYGSTIMARRHTFIQEINQMAAERHAALSGNLEQLRLYYALSFNPGHLSEVAYRELAEGATFPTLAQEAANPLLLATISAGYAAKLRSRRSRELSAGSTLYGPHRDDLRIVANGRDLRTFGSRGQQRTAALALKLAELQVSTATTGAAPMLLLDDVMSELDAHRRSTLLQALEGVEQAMITTTDWADFSPEFLARSARFEVAGGQVQRSMP